MPTRAHVREAAERFNISERTVWKSVELLTSGREDLIREVDAGRMTLHRAMKIAKPERYDRQKPNPIAAAYLKAGLEEREDFIISHSFAVDHKLTDGRLSDLEPRFVCTICGRRGANITSHQPKWAKKERGTD
jgi:hypothetical protein